MLYQCLCTPIEGCGCYLYSLLFLQYPQYKLISLGKKCYRMKLNKELLLTELQFKAVRSSGSGGQNVNKVSSKVVLSWDILGSNFLTDGQKEKLSNVWKNRLSKEGTVVMECDLTRSQFQNKDLVIKRFFTLLEQSLKEVKPRKDTKISNKAIRKRREHKEKLSLKKVLRKRIDKSDF